VYGVDLIMDDYEDLIDDIPDPGKSVTPEEEAEKTTAKYKDSVLDVYKEFGLNPDDGGVSYWVGKLDDANNPTDISKIKAEIKAIAYQPILDIYSELGLTPDDSGVLYWVKELNSTTKPTTIAQVKANIQAAVDASKVVPVEDPPKEDDAGGLLNPGRDPGDGR